MKDTTWYENSIATLEKEGRSLLEKFSSLFTKHSERDVARPAAPPAPDSLRARLPVGTSYVPPESDKPKGNGLPQRERYIVVLTSNLTERGRLEYAEWARGEIRRIEQMKFNRTWKGRDGDLLRLEREILWAETGK